jgi:cysteine desulfuration protein SufE
MRTATPEQLLEDFADCDTWEDRYRYIVELGDELEELPAELKTEENRVNGCVSNVWLIAEIVPGEPPVVHFLADSDSQIVRGLVAILQMLCSGRPADDVVKLDLEHLFKRLDLSKHLSPSRSNGLRSVVKRIRALAELSLSC